MKKYIFIGLISLSLITSSCEDWLNAPTPGTTKLNDFFTSGTTAIQSVNAAYVPLMWEYNSTYYPEWFIGDVVSDDALKGGQSVGDMSDVYDMENFKTNTNNTFLLDYYRAQYQGIGRCNLVLQEVPVMNMDTIMDLRMKNRLIGETKFLRAMYYFRLVRVFGGIPLIDYVVDSSNKWKQPRATAADIYSFIVNDLEDAQSKLWKKSEYSTADLGRATKGAAQAMLLKTYLYMHQYDKAKQWGDSIIDSNEYSLVKYHDNFTLSGENGNESVFEIQYMDDPMSDYGEGNGFTRGTFTVILTRSRSTELGGGWGFNKPTQNLYNEYEPGDPRRDETILNPTDDQIQTPEQEIYLHSTRYVNRKYSMMNEDGTFSALSHNTRAPLNNKVIRYSDVLLMYAEACCENNDLDRAKWALEQVRSRARQGDNSILPAFPYETIIQGTSVKYNDTKDDLIKAIRHERRVELAMEGHRWFDLCRWGIVKEVMDAYKMTENEEVQSHMAPFITGKHELFPIPSQEIELSGIEQNPGY